MTSVLAAIAEMLQADRQLPQKHRDALMAELRLSQIDSLKQQLPGPRNDKRLAELLGQAQRAIDKLSAADRQRCVELWKDVRELLRRAQ